MKKAFKIIALYLAFGVAIAVIITASGGYVNTVVNPTTFGLTAGQYLLGMAGVIILWLPLLVFLFFSNADYLSNYAVKAIIGTFTVIFILLSIVIMKFSEKNPT